MFAAGDEGIVAVATHADADTVVTGARVQQTELCTAVIHPPERVLHEYCIDGYRYRYRRVCGLIAYRCGNQGW
jgi:hypothetical protein